MTIVFMWIANDDPIPPGWRLVRHPYCHHNAYCRLVERIA